jgi:uncharacterized protein
MRGTHVLPLHDLDPAGKPYDAELTEEFLRGQLEETDVAVTAPGKVSVRYSRTGTDVIVHGRVVGSFAVPCARCLSPAVFEVDADLSLLLVPSASERAAHARGRAGVPRRGHRRDREKAEGESATKAGAAATVKGKKGTAAGAGAGKGKSATGEAKATPKHVLAAKHAEEEEQDPADADLDTYEGDELVLDPFLREAILLEVPPFPLCSTDCPGIAPPPTEADEPTEEIDPRLAPLLRFKKQPSLAPSDAVARSSGLRRHPKARISKTFSATLRKG